MKALVFGGPRQRSWTEVPDPQIIGPGDAIIQVDTVTICGTDLHILGGDVPAVQPGRILGHEAVGTVVEVGSAVARPAGRPGPGLLHLRLRPLPYCREGSYGQCRGGGGWILGHLVDGVQAEYARIPFADLSTYPLPESVTDEAAVLLADILPTSYEVGVLNGQVRPGDTVVVVGAGPIGLAAHPDRPAVLAGAHRGDRQGGQPAAGGQATRRRRHGRQPRTTRSEMVRAITDGLGADVVMEAVGTPADLRAVHPLVRPGGQVANIGVHGKPATLHLEDLWIRNVTITTGLVDTYSTPTLLNMVVARAARHRPDHHPPVPARGDHAGVRRVLPASRDRRAKGRAVAEVTAQQIVDSCWPRRQQESSPPASVRALGGFAPSAGAGRMSAPMSRARICNTPIARGNAPLVSAQARNGAQCSP